MLLNPINSNQKLGSIANVDHEMNDSAIFCTSFRMRIISIDPPVFGFEDDNSPLPSLPDKVGTGLGINLGSPNNLKSPVPKLDLTKAKKIQEQNAKKITQQSQPQNLEFDPKAADKVKQ